MNTQSASKAREGSTAQFKFHINSDGAQANSTDSVIWEWQVFALADARARREIEDMIELPIAVRDALLSGELHFNLDMVDGWLHGSLPDLVHETYAISDTLGHLRIAVKGDYLICGRKKPLQSLDIVRTGFEQGKIRLIDPLSFLELFVKATHASLNRRISEASMLLDSIEVRIVGDNWQGEREKLSELRRRAVVLNRQIGSIYSVFRDLLQAHGQELTEKMRNLVQDLLQQNRSLYHDVDQVQARARLLQDEVMARLSERSNTLLSMISIMTAVMLPATIVTGMFGMNTQGLPFESSPYGFWWATLTALVLAGSFYLMVRHFNRRR